MTAHTVLCSPTSISHSASESSSPPLEWHVRTATTRLMALVLCALLLGVAMGDWEYSIDGGGNVGLLLVRPGSSDPWGTVCDDGWSTDGTRNAMVACRSLGYNVTTTLFFTTTGPSNIPIYLDDVSCSGTESSLDMCIFTMDHDCEHTEDIGIECSFATTGSPTTTTDTPTTGTVPTTTTGSPTATTGSPTTTTGSPTATTGSPTTTTSVATTVSDSPTYVTTNVTDLPNTSGCAGAIVNAILSALCVLLVVIVTE